MLAEFCWILELGEALKECFNTELHGPISSLNQRLQTYVLQGAHK